MYSQESLNRQNLKRLNFVYALARGVGVVYVPHREYNRVQNSGILLHTQPPKWLAK